MDIKINRTRMWHENLHGKLDWFGLNEYQLLWIAWAEGLVLGLLLCWIF